MRTLRRLFAVAVVFTPLALASAAIACPNCKDTVFNGDASAEGSGLDTLSGGAGGGVPGGFNTSIYLMLGVFIGTLGLVGHTMYRGARGVQNPETRDQESK